MSLFAGCILPLAFAPYNYSPVALLSLAVLFHAWQNATLHSAFFRGFLFGLGQFGFGITWIYVCVHDFAGASQLTSIFIAASWVVILALFPAVAGYLSVFSVRPGPVTRLVVVMPGFWVFLEWLRAWMTFPGCPWLQVGYSQIDSVLAGFANIGGVYSIGLVVAMAAGLMTTLYRYTSQTRWIALVVILLIGGIGFVFSNIHWTEPAGASFKVTLLQGNISQKVKWESETKKETLRRYIDMTREHWDSRLIVWPETAIPISYHIVSGLLEDLGNEARDTDTDLLIGLPYVDRESDRTFNAVVSVGTDSGFYFKRHLLPFGEYLPYQPVSKLIADYVIDFSMSNFSPGLPDQGLFTAGGFAVAVSICYEDVFGHESLTAMPDARYLVSVTNDAWFGDTIALDQNLQMARMRALETGRYMLRTANTGLTAVISPSGKIIRQLPRLQIAALSETIVPMKGSTPYMYHGDYPLMIIMVCSLFVACFYRGYR